MGKANNITDITQEHRVPKEGQEDTYQKERRTRRDRESTETLPAGP